MGVLLITCSWVLFFLLFSMRKGLRQSFLLAGLIVFLFITTTTEIFSIFGVLQYTSFVYAWSILVLAELFLLLLQSKKKYPFHFFIKRIFLERPKNRGVFLHLLLAYGILSLAILLFLSLAYPPNTGDVLTYHMARVMHWMQNKSVAPYPTSILRQLYQSPLSEFAVLQFQTLHGSDRYANLIQWFSLIGSAIAASLTAKYLGANARGQGIAGFFVLTIPMAILQSTTAKNDVVVSFFLITFICFMISTFRTFTMTGYFAAACALGLAILTKSTAFIYTFPFVLWFFIIFTTRLNQYRWRAISLFILFFFIVGAIIAGQFVRNYSVFHTIIGPNREDLDSLTGHLKYSNDVYEPARIFVNIMRNIGLQIGTPLPQLNRFFAYIILIVHQRLDIPPDDPAITWSSTAFSPESISLSRSDGNASNPLHFFLIIVSFIFVLIYHKKSQKLLLFYLVSTVTTFVIFSTYLKWQPWHSRLHLPFFVLGSAAAGTVLGNISQKLSYAIIFLLVVYSLGYILDNSDRSLLRLLQDPQQRKDMYFNQISAHKTPYMESIAVLRETGCTDIGLLFGRDDPEYLFWVLLQNQSAGNYRLEHIEVRNVSGIMANKSILGPFTPCVVLSTITNAAEIQTSYGRYSLRWSAENWSTDKPSLYVR